jgi:hypothetical protein
VVRKRLVPWISRCLLRNVTNLVREGLKIAMEKTVASPWIPNFLPIQLVQLYFVIVRNWKLLLTWLSVTVKAFGTGFRDVYGCCCCIVVVVWHFLLSLCGLRWLIHMPQQGGWLVSVHIIVGH